MRKDQRTSIATPLIPCSRGWLRSSVLTYLAIGLCSSICFPAEPPVVPNSTLLEAPSFEEVSASVAEPSPSPVSDDIHHSRTGFWGAPVYYGEVFNNARGGLSTNGATRYLGLLDIPVALEFRRLGLPLPGRFFILGQSAHGEGLTDRFVGDSLVLSNIDAFVDTTRVGEYWWEVDLFERRVLIRLGKQDVNTEFLRIDTAQDFIQSTFGLSPSTAFPTYPNQSMAAAMLVRVSSALVARVGIWDAFASGDSWGFSGNGSIFLVGELEYSYSLRQDTLPGKVAVGATYESAGLLFGEPISAVHEYSFQIEQMLHRESSAIDDDLQGLSLFAGYYPRFPGRLVTEKSLGDSVIAGFVYTGLIPQRDDDVTGVGVAWAELYRGGTGQETVFECFYKANLSRRFSLQPDVQYIVSPSGIYKDALVFGLRFILAW